MDNQQEIVIEKLKELKPDIFEQDSDPCGYLNRIWQFLNDITVNKVYNVDLLSNETELFVNVVKYYILTCIDNTVIFLRDDFKQFRKNLE